MDKTDIRVRKTYRQLLAGFLKLLSDNNTTFEELTVSDICKAAEVHRATFYKHFKDKHDFLNFCFENYLAEIKLNTLEENPSVENIKEAFMFFIIRIFDFIKKNKPIFALICSDKYAFTLGAAFAHAIDSYCYEKIKKTIPQASNERAEIFSSFYSNAFIGVLKWYARYEGDYPLEDIYDFLEHRVDELCDTYIKKYI